MPKRISSTTVSLARDPQVSHSVEIDSDAAESVFVRATRWLIWLYLILWIIEGALRKWYLPSLSNPLLVVRDPVVILIYMMAFAGNRFPMNRIVGSLIALGAVCFAAGFLVTGNLLMTAFGFRSNFLHLPLIYVMAQVLRPADLRRIGWFLLVCSVPMVLIMVKQFRSDYDSWWNFGAGGGRQIISVGSKIRAAGTFSFISGPIAFFSMIGSYLLASVMLKKWYRWWLLIPAGAATILAAAVAGSRSLLTVLIIDAVIFLIGCSRYPRAMQGVGRITIGAFLSFLCVGSLSVYKEGKEVTTERATDATQNEGGLEGFIHRAIDPLIITPDSLSNYKILGNGLGTGTVAAASLAKGGDAQPVWAEQEWDRVLLESGPILGLAYLILRASMTIMAFVQAMQAARGGNLLAIALFGAAAPQFLTGQFGQPTTLGAAVLAMGLSAAALSLKSTDTAFGVESDEAQARSDDDLTPREITASQSPAKRYRGRSSYAQTLHRK
jgi:hypothetical protein